MNAPDSLLILISVFTFALGACIGSFLNVCIHRIPRSTSVVRPRSFCPHCGTTIAWYHNIPLVSYLALGATCRRCGAPISVRYFIVESLTALLFLLIWLKLACRTSQEVLGLSPISHWQLVPVYWILTSGLILGTFVDFEHLIIPDRVTLGGIVAGILFSGLIPEMHGQASALGGVIWSCVGATTGVGLLWLVAIFGRFLFRKEAMGLGDVKLMGAIGAFLGWRAVLFTIFTSSLVGSITGVSLVLLNRKKMQSRIPYGPYIALAATIWILWGPRLWSAYLDFIYGIRLS